MTEGTGRSLTRQEFDAVIRRAAELAQSDPSLGDFMQIFGLMEGDPVVRGAAAVAMWRLGDTQHIRDLLSLLRDQDPEVRWRAAFAVWRLKDPRAKSVVEAALADADPRVRMFSARALGEIGDDISADWYGRSRAKSERWRYRRPGICLGQRKSKLFVW